MQIHELNNYTGNLDQNAFAVVDNGADTGKVTIPNLIKAATDAIDLANTRIDNIITSPAPTNEEIIDARLGADGVTYDSLGDAIREQFTNEEAKIAELQQTVLEDVTAVYTNGVSITQGGRLGSGNPVININIPTGESYKFELIDAIGAFTAYTLYETDSNGTHTNKGYYSVNTEVSLTASVDVVYLSIYPNSTHQATGIITAEVSITTHNSDTLQEKVKALEISASLIEPQDTSFLEAVLRDTNLIDASKAIANSYIADGGVVAATSNVYATDFIRISDDRHYYVQYAYTGYYAYYNAAQECIAYYGLNEGEILDPQNITELTPPSGAKYVRFTIYYTRVNDAWLNLQNHKPTGLNVWDDSITVGGYCNYTGGDIGVFAKGICIGDSLTEGTYNYNEGGTMQYGTYGHGDVLHDYSYPAKLSELLGIDITNRGIGGQTSAEWWALMSTVDFSGHDFAIIQFGVNDVSRYGTWGSTSETAYTNIINKLKTDNPGIKIFVATIVPATAYSGSAYDNFSEAIRTFVSGLNDDDVILADIAAYGHTAESDGYNAGHLSAYGYWRLAKDYEGLISYLMFVNKTNYRDVQFIGTTHSYTD